MPSAPRSRDPWTTALLAVGLAAFLVWIAAPFIGATEPPDGAPARYRTYFEVASWWAFPFFFLGLAPLLWLTWCPMLRSWASLAETGVLRGPDGPADASAVAAVIDALEGMRGIAIAAALLVTFAINAADLGPRLGILLGFGGLADLADQVAYACLYPDAHVRWLIEEIIRRPISCGWPLPAPAGDAITPTPSQLALDIPLALQQILIVFFGALAIIQILLHALLFAVFESLPVARERNLRIELNGRSPMNEFGLEHWNHALNNFYWAASPALLGVFLSRASTPPGEYMPGQQMLGFVIPACVIAPMIATIIARQMIAYRERKRFLQPYATLWRRLTRRLARTSGGTV